MLLSFLHPLMGTTIKHVAGSFKYWLLLSLEHSRTYDFTE
jgi:hypothetical protein